MVQYIHYESFAKIYKEHLKCSCQHTSGLHLKKKKHEQKIGKDVNHGKKKKDEKICFPLGNGQQKVRAGDTAK